MKLDFHPLADKFPLMTPAESEALNSDIALHGLRDPIYLYEGKIIDGRNRYLACRALGMKLRRGKEILDAPAKTDQEAATFSISRNLQRRHLSVSQQAMFIVTAGLIPQSAETSKRRYRTGESAIRQISVRYGVSHVSLYKALYVMENDADLTAKVLQGELSVGKAEQIIRCGNPQRNTTRDAKGVVVTSRLIETFQAADMLEGTCTKLRVIREELDKVPSSLTERVKAIQTLLAKAIADLEKTKPYVMCEQCNGKGCARCGRNGWLPK